ncbi:MAG: zinc ABC transporter substrate-binding protein [Lachnospiraceae bacterium]|nr:zinc ABC transporter substrate-binding protein [Lachnospiraceae bacterium]
MRNKYRFTAVLLLAIAVCAYLLTGIYVKSEKTDTDGQFLVVTSFYPMYIAALNVAGDCENIRLENLSEPQTGCLHDFQMTPEDMKLLSTADVFVVNGGGMESFLTDVAKQYPNLLIVESMTGEHAEEEHVHEEEHAAEEEHVHEEAHAAEEEHVHEEEHAAEEEHVHEEAHVHADGSVHTHSHENTHVWMSVAHHREQIAAITHGLCEAIPAYAEEFEANAAEYDAKLADLQKQQEELVSLSTGKEIIAFHEAYEYLAEDYGMEIAYTMNLDEERQISAGEVADVLAAVKEHGIDLIFAEELYGRGLAETVQKEADVTVCYLDTLVRGEYEADSYIKGMQKNIDIVKSALGMEAP